MKSDKSALGEISSFKMVGLSLFLLDLIRALTLSQLLKLPQSVLIRSMKFLFPELALYFYKSIIRLCMKYCCHISASSYYLDILHKLQKWTSRTLNPPFAASFEPLGHRRNLLLSEIYSLF